MTLFPLEREKKTKIKANHRNKNKNSPLFSNFSLEKPYAKAAGMKKTQGKKLIGKL
jgi:hypothetical protein